MHAMERSEPSLVPEWLRSNGGGGSIHHFASSQAGCSSSPRRSSNGNGFSKHDKNSYARSYSSFSRNHRDRDRERSTVGESWDSDPVRGMIRGKAEDSLRRSKSLISRRQGEAPQQRVSSDMRNGVHKNHNNGNYSAGGNDTGSHKVSFERDERDFPVLRSEDRPKTPDIIRVLSPVLNRGIQSFSIGNPPSAGGEVWTSALAEAPTGPGSNSGVGTLPSSTTDAANSSPAPVSANPLPGLNMAETLVQAPAQSHHTAPQPSAQLQKEELALAQSKKLIPVTPLLTKTTVLSSSDKLKPKTATMRSTEPSLTPKNGVHHLSPLQLGSQPARGASVRGDDPKSPSSKLLVLKPGRENGVSHGLKDLQIPTTNINTKVASNGQSTGSPSKNLSNPRILPGVDKRTSRSNFFKLVREKSLNNTLEPVNSGASVSLEKEAKELGCIQVTPDKTESELKCNGEACTVADDLSPSMKIDDEEERAFLLSLGWEDNAEDGEEGLTNKEIEAFYNEVMKQGATSRLCRVLQAKLFSQVGCSSSNEPNSSVSQTEA